MNEFNKHLLTFGKNWLRCKVIRCKVFESQRFLYFFPPRIMCEHDGINNKMIELCDEDFFPVAYLFNQMLIYGKLPDVCKRAEILPLHMKNFHKEPANFRPKRSLFSSKSKIFKKKTFQWLNKFKILAVELCKISIMRSCKYSKNRGTLFFLDF